jgi:hypothetical protein
MDSIVTSLVLKAKKNLVCGLDGNNTSIYSKTEIRSMSEFYQSSSSSFQSDHSWLLRTFTGFIGIELLLTFFAPPVNFIPRAAGLDSGSWSIAFDISTAHSDVVLDKSVIPVLLSMANKKKK